MNLPTRWIPLALLLLAASTTSAADARRPNVVLFLVDDMGWMDCGAYGSRYYETPNIDRLAKRGVRFTDAYSANPLCSPTRASILTGKYPARVGITSAVGHRPPLPADAPRYPDKAPPNRPIILAESLRYLPPEEYTLAEALRDAGYATGHFGKWHLGLTEPHWPERQGYDLAWHGKPDPGPPPPAGYFSPYSFKAGTIEPGPEGEYIVDRLTDEALAFIEQNQKRPFFAAVWQYGVHGPWDHKEEYTKAFVDKQDPRGCQGNPVMASMLRSVDESLGRIVARLDELNLSDNTIILFASDNGGNVHSNTRSDRRKASVKPGHPQWRSLSSYRKYAGYLPPTNNAPLRDGKGTLYEGGVRIPVIAVWPKKIAEGGVSSQVISTIDFYPTLLELLGLSKKEGVQFDGISFAPVLRDPDATLPREALFNYFPHGGPTKPPGVTVRQGRWKLIHWFETGPDYPSPYELYDLQTDLGETRNLARDQGQRVVQLDALIAQFLKDTGAAAPRPNPAYDRQAALLQGWVVRFARAAVEGDVLRLVTQGRRPFLATVRSRAAGPLEVRFRMRTASEGRGQLQWRTAAQEAFPETGQTAPYRVAAGWHDVRVPLSVEGQLAHVRLYLPVQAEPIDLDWIELWQTRGDEPRRVQRWDFRAEE